jgi:hypothetical protein
MAEKIYQNPQELSFIQSRAETNQELIAEYAEMMQDGVEFDPAQGVQDEAGRIFIHDGLHRGEAAKVAGVLLLVEVAPGTKQDAEWLALSANQKHGLRRTQADKQVIIRKALLHPYGVKLSNREIARHCGVSDKTVGRIRREMETTAEIPQLDKRVVQKADGTTYEIDTTNIGSSQPEYVPVWKLETAVRYWLESSVDEATAMQVLEAIKHKTAAGQEYLEELLTGNLLPTPHRKGDVIQACHNLLDQLSSRSQTREPHRSTLESSSGWWSGGIVEQERTPGPLAGEPADEQEPKSQEFQCPRCGREKIVGVNGSRRWCLNCGAEWPTAVLFLEELQANPEPATVVSRQESAKPL